MFNTAESEIIIGLLDYLALGPEYILFLCAYLGKKGRKSLRYIEKTAIALHDAGIVTYEQLELHLRKLDKADDAEKQLRDLFGIGQRALIKREREAFFRWISEWEMPVDVITRAYEITVNNTGDSSVPYTNAILEKWNAEGVKTTEQVDEMEAARKNVLSVTAASSFETEDFFDLALKRSYGDKK
jgi:DnaD/phage-associated family protein